MKQYKELKNRIEEDCKKPLNLRTEKQLYDLFSPKETQNDQNDHKLLCSNKKVLVNLKT